MISIYSFFPIFVVAIASMVLNFDFAWLPDWYKVTYLNLINSLEFLFGTLMLIFMMLYHEASIKFSNNEQRMILRRVTLSYGASLIFYLLNFKLDLDFNFREFCQEYSINLVFNFTKIIILFFYFGIVAERGVSMLLMAILIGFINLFSGSKSSLIIPALVVLMAFGRINLGSLFILVFVVLLGLVGFIPINYFVRYLDMGLSSYQTAFIYQETNIPLIDYYIGAVKNLFVGSSGFNPVVEYLNDTKFAAGYNLTPTIVGELMGSGAVVGVFILLMLGGYFACMRHVWPNTHVKGRRYFAANLFMMLNVMQSSLMDVVFYPIFFIFFIFLIVSFRRLMSLQREL